MVDDIDVGFETGIQLRTRTKVQALLLKAMYQWKSHTQ